jgi:hypothetical protein
MGGGEEKHLWVIGGKARRRKILGSPRRRWVDDIEMDLGRVRWGAVHCIGLAWGKDQCRAFVNMVVNL